MQKRGVSHIEVILSSVLFIAALLAVFYFFSPVDNSKVANSALNYVFDSIIAKSSDDLITYSIKVNETEPNVVGTVIGISVDNKNIKPNMKSYAEGFEGGPLKSKREGNDIYIQRNDESLFYLEFSEGFDQNSWNPPPGIENKFYEVGTVSSRKAISEKVFMNLNSSYYTDYNLLKTQLNVPNGVNFAFGLFFIDGRKVIAEKIIPKGAEVYSKSSRVEIINKEGGISFADLIVRVW